MPSVSGVSRCEQHSDRGADSPGQPDVGLPEERTIEILGDRPRKSSVRIAEVLPGPVPELGSLEDGGGDEVPGPTGVLSPGHVSQKFRIFPWKTSLEEAGSALSPGSFPHNQEPARPDPRRGRDAAPPARPRGPGVRRVLRRGDDARCSRRCTGSRTSSPSSPASRDCRRRTPSPSISSPSPVASSRCTRPARTRSSGEAAVELVAEPIPEVSADRDQIVQVLTNLVQNGLDAAGAVRADPRVVVTVGPLPGDRVRIVVRDNGPGVAEDMVPACSSRTRRARRRGRASASRSCSASSSSTAARSPTGRPPRGARSSSLAPCRRPAVAREGSCHGADRETAPRDPDERLARAARDPER